MLKRIRFRSLIVMAMVVLAIPCAWAQAVSLDLPSQPLAVSLRAVGSQTGTNVLFDPPLVEGINAPGVEGDFTAEEAFKKLLAGTGLKYRFLDEKTVMVISASEAPVKPAAQVSASPTLRLAQNAEAKRAEPTAQSANAEPLSLEEVVVTATKHEERLQDVPIAITALSSRDITARGIADYADVLNSVPGVYYEDAGPGDTEIRIRGISQNGGGTPPTVATYFGEIPMSVQGGGNLGQNGTPRFVDIDRVEVLRGPQGTVFGANALAGAVRVIPAPANVEKFEYDLGTRGSAVAHSGDMSYHFEGVLNLPLVQDRFAIRLVGHKDDIAGYIDNVTPARAPIDYSFLVGALTGGAVTVPDGTLLTPATPALDEHDINSTDISGGRLSAAWQVNDRLRFDLLVDTQDAKMHSESSVTAGTYRIARGMDAFIPGHTSEDLDLAGLTIRYDWDGVSLISATSRTRLQVSRVSDASNLLPPLPWLFGEKRSADTFTQEVRLQSRGEGAFRWTVGGFYLDSDSHGRQHVADFSCAASPPCLPLLFSGGAQDFPIDLGFKLFEEQKAVFVDTSYEFAPRWTLGLGARYLEEDVGVRLDAIGFLAPPPGASNGGEDSASKFNPAVSLRFKPYDDLTVYLQAAEGFRSGVANQALPQACRDDAAELGLALQTVTDPDTVRNYELGLKSSLAGRRITVNAAVYRLEWRDMPGTVLFQCNFSNIVNAGDATGKGVEVEMAASLTRAWKLNLSAAHNKLTYDDNVLPQIGTSGKQVAGSPARNFSAGVEYDFNVGSLWSGSARADWAYVGRVRSDFGSLPRGSFDTLNLRLGVMREGALAIELFGRNVTDERGVSSVEPLPFGGEETLIRPREIGLEVRYSYR